MRHVLKVLIVGAALGLFATVAVVQAGEKKVELDKVPKAVMDAIKAKFPNAKLLGASTEIEGDKTVYEISLTYKDHHYDVTLEPEGKILDIEKEIPVKDLPKVITDALEAKYPKAKLSKAEELIKGDGKLHAYEVILTTADNNTFEVVLDLKGKITKEEKKEKKKDSK
jgi:uncharacterized membrane protein YkoI